MDLDKNKYSKLYIEHALTEFENKFGIKKPITDKGLFIQFSNHLYSECVLEIMQKMGLSNKVKVTCYADYKFPKSNCAAFVSLPINNMPLWGSKAFTNTVIPISIRKSLTEKYESFVYAVAHELSHIVLHSTKNSLKDSEIATDLFVMACGFDSIMENGRYFRDYKNTTKYGYLDDEHFKFALAQLKKLRKAASEKTLATMDISDEPRVKSKMDLDMKTPTLSVSLALDIESAAAILASFGIATGSATDAQKIDMATRLVAMDQRNASRVTNSPRIDLVDTAKTRLEMLREKAAADQLSTLAAAKERVAAMLARVAMSATNPYLIPYRKKDKWGYCTAEKVALVDCIYDSVRPFSENIATVQSKKGWGLINIEGQTITPLVYSDISNFREGLAIVTISEKAIGNDCIQSKAQKTVWNYQSKKGFIDKTGILVVPCVFEDAMPFSEGWAAIMKNGKWGFIDRACENIIPCIFDEVKRFSENVCAVKFNNKWGYIDQHGHEVIPFNLKEADNFEKGFAWITDSRNEINIVNKQGVVEHDLFLNQSPTKSDYIRFLFTQTGSDTWANAIVDNKGAKIFPPIITRYSEFSEDLCAIEIEGKWGFINTKGEIAISNLYEYAFDFSEELAGVVLNNKVGYINKMGEVVIPFVFDYFCYEVGDSIENDYYIVKCNFKNGLAAAVIGDKFGYIDKSGIWKVECKYNIAIYYMEYFRYEYSGFEFPSFENPATYIQEFDCYIDQNGFEYYE